MPNRLAACSSPYLLQHQDNPVDWYPWGSEAFDKARLADRPIFLSVGYSACHWCHVMEHESFENAEIAAILNEHFVSIKVDREERPDVDQIYMQAVQMLTGSGGWPMSVFMTHDGKPFFGGTYWPPDNRWGRPGFGQVLLAVVEAWKNKRDQIAEQGEQIATHLQSVASGPASADSPLNVQWLRAAEQWLLRQHDSQHGGFGSAPKFPHAMDLALLLELSAFEPHAARSQAVRTTLDHMSRGGIYDHLGGGFARYSVDERWLVPHFEKMLYDNALLASLYANASRLWQDDGDRQVAQETLDYILRDMTDPSGAFYSTEDADSEGVEGKFYVWTPGEIQDALGKERAERFCQVYDVTEAGNFEEQNILNLPKSIEQFAQLHNLPVSQLRAELAEDRERLLEHRETRVRPGLDDKALLSWNALMITGFVHGYRASGDARYLRASREALAFIEREMLVPDTGRLWHTWRRGHSSLAAYLDDYSYLLDAIGELFQVDSQPRYLKFASDLARVMLEQFKADDGGFYFTSHDHEQLIARSKDLTDSSVPSANAMAASGLLTLARLTGRQDLLAASEDTLTALSGLMSNAPQAAGQALRVLLRHSKPSREYVLFGAEDEGHYSRARRELLRIFEPDAIMICIASAEQVETLAELCPLVAQRGPLHRQTTLYVCQGNTCQQPLVGDSVLEFLDSRFPGATP